MEASQDLDLEPGVSAAETAVDSASVLDRMKQRRDARGDFITFDIPSWDGDLKARYEALEREEVEKMVRRIRARSNGAASSGIEADCDFLEKSCVEIIGYDSDTDEEFHVADGYTMDFAKLLNPTFPPGHPQEGNPVPIQNVRELIVYLVKWNSIALAAHGQKVAKWMQELKKPIEDPT